MTATALASVSWGVLALGAVYPWAYWPLIWGAFVTGFLGLQRSSGLLSTLRHPLLLAVLALCLAVLLQLIPLSSSVLQTVSPSTDAFVQTYLTLPDEVVAAATDGLPTSSPAQTGRPLSLRPQATATALAFTLAFGLVVAGGATGLTARDARRLAVGLLVLGVFVAFLAIVQRGTPNYRIYWQPPEFRTAWGPFVNRNHFAGWMVMAISVALGYFMALSGRAMRHVEGWRNRILWLSSREATGIVLTGVALVVMGLSLVLTVSRSGMGSLVAAMFVIAVAAIRKRGTADSTQPRRAMMIGSIVCLALVTVVWTGLPLVQQRFSYSPGATPFALSGRIQLWKDAIEVARRFPVTGTGVNTYTVVTPFFQRTENPNADQAHNDYLQLAAEGGLLVGVPAIALIVIFVREVRRRFRSPNRSLTSYWLRVGAVAGLVAIALQETVEFSLQLPGNAVMFAVLCSLAVHKPDIE